MGMQVDDFDTPFTEILDNLESRKVIHKMRSFKETKKGAAVVDIQSKKRGKGGRW